MTRNPTDTVTELRRALPLVSGVLFVVALAFPMWRIVLTAPQYPGRALPVKLYAYPRIGGEYVEVERLNHYVGFHYPDPVFLEPNYEVSEAALAMPEWSLAPALFVLLALVSVAVAFSPAEKIAWRLTYFLAATLVTFVALLAWLQYRLYQAGHELDPNAPMSNVEFTPPVLGPYDVANISGFAWFDVGGYLVLAAVACLAGAFLVRDDTVTVGELPDLLAAGTDRVRARFTQ